MMLTSEADGVRHALPHVGQGGFVGDGVDGLFLKNGGQGCAVPDVGFVERSLVWQVVAMARVQVVHDDHVVAGRDQGVGDMAADESGSAGDENVHKNSWILDFGLVILDCWFVPVIVQ